LTFCKCPQLQFLDSWREENARTLKFFGHSASERQRVHTDKG
jgi:hypothetical protein